MRRLLRDTPVPLAMSIKQNLNSSSFLLSLNVETSRQQNSVCCSAALHLRARAANNFSSLSFCIFSYLYLSSYQNKTGISTARISCLSPLTLKSLWRHTARAACSCCLLHFLTPSICTPACLCHSPLFLPCLVLCMLPFCHTSHCLCTPTCPSPVFGVPLKIVACLEALRFAHIS